MGQTTCLDCWHADDNPPTTSHCGSCPCCSTPDKTD